MRAFCTLLTILISTSLWANDVSEFSLEELLNEKISTASKYEQNISEVPAFVTIISAEEIRGFSYSTLAEALNSIAGFFIRNDRIYTYIGTRGFESLSSYGNKILLLLNGHTMNDNVYGGTYYANDFGLDIDNIERIEIVRGPGSSIYGTGAIFSVINVITKSGDQIDGVRFSGTYGSNSRYLAKSSFGKIHNNGLEVLISGVYGQSDGENLRFEEFKDQNNGLAENLDFEKHYGAFLGLKYNDLALDVKYNKREKGIPTAPWGIVFNDQSSISIDERYFAELRYVKKLDHSKSFAMRAFFDSYLYEGTYPYILDGIGYKVTNDRSEGRWLGAEAKIIWDIAESSRLISGLEYTQNLKSDIFVFNGTEKFYIDSPFNVFSAYTQNTTQLLDNLSLTLGLRLDKDSRQDAHLTPRASLVYFLDNKSTAKFIYGTAFRAPNTSELSYGDNMTSKGNPNLQPEKIQSLELVFDRKFSQNFVATFALFNYNMTDLIEETLDTNDSLTVFINSAKAKAIGAELDFRFRIVKKLNAYLNFTLQNCSTGDLFEHNHYNYPAFIAKGGFYYNFFNNFTAGFDFYYENGRETIHDLKTNPYFSSNLTIGLRPIDKSLDKFNYLNSIEIFFKVRNLFNREFYHPSGYEHIQKQIIQPVRSFRLEMNYLFNFD